MNACLEEALGNLAPHVEINTLIHSDPSASRRDTALWDVLSSNVRAAFPEAQLFADVIVGGTDARFFRAKGTTAYGAGLFSSKVTLESFGNRFHGNDERVDVESLGLTTDLWVGVARQLLGE